MGVENQLGYLGPSLVYDIFPGTDTVYSGVKAIAIQGSSGNISLLRPDGTAETIPVLSGQVLPIGLSKILASGTTATDILVMR